MFLDKFSNSICELISKLSDQKVIGLVTCTGIITAGVVTSIDKISKCGLECGIFKLGMNNNN